MLRERLGTPDDLAKLPALIVSFGQVRQPDLFDRLIAEQLEDEELLELLAGDEDLLARVQALRNLLASGGGASLERSQGS